MKHLGIILPLMVLFVFISPNKSNAQIIDSLPYFKLPVPELVGKIDWNLDLNFSKKARKSLAPPSNQMKKKIDFPVDSKTYQIKRKVTVNTPMGVCYEISPGNEDCKQCFLFWNDKNGDKKLQPREELRCICFNCEEPCSVKGKKVLCVEEEE